MHTQLKKVHDVHAPRDVVYAVMGILDPEGLEGRRPGKEKIKKERKVIFHPSAQITFIH